MPSMIFKDLITFNIELLAHTLAKNESTDWLLLNGWEWFDFEGVKWKDYHQVPHKAKALYTKSRTAVREAMRFCRVDRELLPDQEPYVDAEAREFIVEANYSHEYDQYVPPCPSGLEYLEHQIESARWLLNRNKLLLADKPGLGKTISAYCSLNSVNDVNNKKHKMLIVSPAKLQKGWVKEGNKWAIGYDSKEIAVLKSGASIDPDVKILVTSYESLDLNMPELLEFGAEIIIADEAHLVKNDEAKRTQNLVWLIQYADYVMLMTGTPILNRHKELYILIQMLMPDLLPHYHCFGFYPDELRDLLLDHIMLLRDESVLKHKIPKHESITYPVSVDFQPEYAGFKKPESVLRHEVGLSKIPKAIDLSHELLESNEKLVVYTYHTDVADKIADALSKSYEVVVSHGKKTNKQASEAESQFRTGSARVFIATMKACGAGLTLIEANNMIVVELDWTPANLEQTEKRISRIGQTLETTAHYIIAEGVDVEEHMLQKIEEKNQITSIF